MSSRVDAAERLLALVIALSHTHHRMTKAQIRHGVVGYADAATDDAFDRMFERDKDTLRSLGVPLLTLTDPTHEDDIGYRIDTSDYALPAVDFTPAEVGVLSLAAQVWQDSTLSSQAQRALTKLRAVTGPGEAVAPRVALRVQGPDEAFDVLLEAIVARQPVRFSYRAANSGTTAVRHVEPWRVFAKDRGWYLVGLDRDRGAQRHFRLSRISGRVHRIGEPGQVQIPADGERAGSGVRTRVTVAVRPDRAAALRAKARDTERRLDGRDVLELESTDPELLAEQVAGYGDAVVVLAPAAVRDAVLRRLQAVASLGAPDG